MPRGPIRVLILIGQLQRGGAERQVHELASRLDRKAFEPTVLTFEAGGHYQPLLEETGVRVIALDKRGWREALATARLASIMGELRTDVAHAFLFPASWRAILAARLAGVGAVVCSVRSTGVWMSARHRLMDGAALRRASVVVANAPAVRNDVVRRTGVPPERVRVIMNGVDLSIFHPGDSSLRRSWGGASDPGTRVAGFVGSFREAKDPSLFVRLAGEVARRLPAARFVMVGDGPLRPRVESMAREEGLGDRLTLAGERSDIPEVLRSLDLLAVTSAREGCCNAILEAMATGLPVAATAVGGNPDLVTHGENGWLFPYGDGAAGAEGVTALLADRDRAIRMGARGLAVARERFSMESMVQATARLYESLV